MKKLVLVITMTFMSTFGFSVFGIEATCPNLQGKYQLLEINISGMPEATKNLVIEQIGCEIVSLTSTKLNDDLATNNVKISVTGEQYLVRDNNGEPLNHLKANWTGNALKLEFDYTSQEPSRGNTSIQYMSKSTEGLLIIDFAMNIKNSDDQIRMPEVYIPIDNAGNQLKLK